MFEEMMEQIRFNITKIISFVEIKTEAPATERSELQVSQDNEKECLENLGNKKISRNAICPRTGKKYKRCCGKL